MRSSQLLIVSSLVLAAVQVGCVENSFRRPAEAEDVVYDHELRNIEDAGMEIHGGRSPPEFSATYRVEPDGEILSADNESAEVASECTRRQSFESPDSNARVEFSVEEVGGGDDCEDSWDGAAYVSGHGNCFTLYNRVEDTVEGCFIERVQINSACIDGDSGNLVDVQTAFLTRRAEGTGCGPLIEEGKLDRGGQMRVMARNSPIEPVDD